MEKQNDQHFSILQCHMILQKSFSWRNHSEIILSLLIN